MLAIIIVGITMRRLYRLLLLALWYKASQAFVPRPSVSCRASPASFAIRLHQRMLMAAGDSPTTLVTTVEEASHILEAWDKSVNQESEGSEREENGDADQARSALPHAIRLLSERAAKERSEDSLKGRCMLGICASSAEEGIATLKSWVSSLELPRGLLHGMDKDGVPIDVEGSVYIKYNTGGVLSFGDIRKSGMGFDALWKPGDAMIEEYDGTYRGVYFQVELSDGEFRQYLVPLNTLDVH